MVKKIYYDSEADILYIVVREGEVEDTVEICEDIFVEYGGNGEIMGIEIWRASRNIIEPISKEIASRVENLIRRSNT
ncbi:MAG: DUF2283 domain-containing protein [Candidatus Baldrarchaeia archaeon]